MEIALCAAQQQTIGSVGVPEFGGENAGEETAEHTANAVDAPHIQGVVQSHLVLELNGQIAEHTRQDSDGNRAADARDLQKLVGATNGCW